DRERLAAAPRRGDTGEQRRGQEAARRKVNHLGGQSGRGGLGWRQWTRDELEVREPGCRWGRDDRLRQADLWRRDRVGRPPRHRRRYARNVAEDAAEILGVARWFARLGVAPRAELLLELLEAVEEFPVLLAQAVDLTLYLHRGRKDPRR